MTIEIFSTALAEKPTETHYFEGSIAHFIKSCGIEYKYKSAQPVSISVNAEVIDCKDWNYVFVKAEDVVQIRVIPYGGVFKAVSKVFTKVFSFLAPKPKTPSITQQKRVDTPKGNQLEVSNASANTAKLNQTVPEMAGRFIRYPEHLVPPRDYFFDQRTQYQEMLLCIGVGYYEIDPNNVKVGTTPLNNLEGAEFEIYPPGADVTGLGTHENWYKCPEVGGTSSGTAGLTLSAAPSSDLEPTASQYVFDNKTLTTPTALPSAWAVGTEMQIRINRQYTTTDAGAYSLISGSFVDIAHLDVGDIVSSRVGETLRIESLDLDVAGNGTATFDYLNEFDVWLPVKVEESTDIGFWFADPAISLKIKTLSALSATYDAYKEDVLYTGWFGFGSVTVLPQNVNFIVQGAGSSGEWAGPFNACPVSEQTTEFEVDLFFPRGLCRVASSGALTNQTVSVEIEYRNSGGAWQRVTKAYTAKTMDQLGFTEKLTLPVAGVPECRIRRRGAVSTSTSIYDEVEWFSLRAKLKTPTSYTNWTTMGVRFKGLGKISGGSENKINVIATRKLPLFNPDGTVTEDLHATRDVSAFALYISRSVGYKLEDWDLLELAQLNMLWKSRGETLDFVFSETTVKNALDITANAAMSEIVIEDSLLTPIREGVRTTFEQAYSAQNTTSGFNRAFKLPRVDSNDGVLVEFIDAQDGFTAKTVECKLPGKPGVRLLRISVDGVVGRTRAWRIGMRKARELEYENLSYTFNTELDAMNSRYMSYVALIPDIANYGQSAMLLQVRGNTLIASENMNWQEGANHVVAWRNATGRFIGPFPATQGLDTTEIVVSGVPYDVPLPVVRLDMEPPHVFFGTISKLCFPALVQRIQPSANGQCSVQAVGYDACKYDDDDNFPPAE